MDKNPSNLEILQAVNAFATDVTENFAEVKQDIKSIDKRLTKVESDLTHVKSEMVTKSYLDEKLATVNGNIVKLDKKVDKLATTLHQEGHLSEDGLATVTTISPFSKLA